MMTDTIALHADTPIRQSDNVVAVEVTDEAILLDVDSGFFFQLNNTAASIWRLVETPTTFGELCAALQRDFAAGADALEEDARGFVQDLAGRGILQLG